VYNDLKPERVLLWHYFALFNEIIRSLTSDIVHYTDLATIENMIDVWSELVPQLFGVNHLTFNCHLMTHLVKYVRLFGPLHNFSAFPFESFVGSFCRLVTSTKGSLLQIGRRFAQYKMTLAWNKQSFIRTEICSPLDSGFTHLLQPQHKLALQNSGVQYTEAECIFCKRLQVKNVVYHTYDYNFRKTKICSCICSIKSGDEEFFARIEHFIKLDGIHYIFYKRYNKVGHLLDDVPPPTDENLLPYFNNKQYGNFFTPACLGETMLCVEANAIIQKAILIRGDGDELYLTKVAHMFEHN
jgi:hypothetical protein